MCFPWWTDVVLEEEVPKKKKDVLFWDPRIGAWVRIDKKTKVPVESCANLIMAAAAPVPEQNVVPQIRDPADGNPNHTYIPRADGSILIGGVIYIPQNAAAVPAVAAVSTPVVPVVAPQPVYPPPQPLIPPQQAFITPPQPVYQVQPQYPLYSYQIPGAIPGPAALPAIQPYPSYPTLPMGYGQYTFGQTGNEVLAGQMQYAKESDINKKQDMKPADDDPFRMYWCRELDGTWTQRSRLTIDSGDIGDCRWYSMDGQFYCVRLSDG